MFLTIDLEDYHWQFMHRTGQDRERLFPWFEDDLNRIADFLGEMGIKTTFFTPGYIAKRAPRTLKRLSAGGHEIACHGLNHDKVFQQGRQKFSEDLRAAKDHLEQAVGKEVSGFRAPAFSVSRDTPWFFETLAHCGFRYDSSARFPGLKPMACQFPIPIGVDRNVIWEFPFRSIGRGPKRLTVIGGSYLRLLPTFLIRLLLRGSARKNFVPLIYLHPYDAQFPVQKVNSNHLPRIKRAKAWVGHLLRQSGTKYTLAKLRALVQNADLRGPLVEAIPAQPPKEAFPDQLVASLM